MTPERRAYMERYKREHGDRIRAGRIRYNETHKKERYIGSRTPNIRLSVARHRAKKRKLDFDLSLDFYTTLIQRPCFYCAKITFGNEVGVGLDRIDHNKGYLPDNVLPCCSDCNHHRSNTWTVEEMQAAFAAVQFVRARKELPRC